LTRLSQRFEKILPIHVTVVNVLTPIPTAHHTCPADLSAEALAKAEATAKADDGALPDNQLVIDVASPPFPSISLNL
jgi:hypothetical protein